MTEHDANAPLTEEDVAAIEAALVDYEEGVAYDKKHGEIPRGLDVHVDADDVRRLVAEVRRQRAELARLQDIHDNSNLAYERLIRDYRAEIEALRVALQESDRLNVAMGNTKVSSKLLPQDEILFSTYFDNVKYLIAPPAENPVFRPSDNGSKAYFSRTDGGEIIPTTFEDTGEPPIGTINGRSVYAAPRFRVGQRVRQKADATPREGVVVRIDMHFPLLNGQTLPCANIKTDEGETFWWALDYLEDAT